MGVSYNDFVEAFLAKITEYDLLGLDFEIRDEVIKGYFKRTIASSKFKKVISYDFTTTFDEETGEFDIDIDEYAVDEIVDIVSDGMIVQWFKPYVNKQELLENVLSTRDYSLYSPAELLLRVGNAYEKSQKDYVQALREYSYNHGDLTDLHL